MRRRTLPQMPIAEKILDSAQLVGKSGRTRLMIIDTYRSRVLLVLFAAAVLTAGLLALVETTPARAADRIFEPAPNSPFSVGSSPTTVTNADFNDDGKMDLAAQNSGSNSVSVRLGNGDGTFQAKQDFAVGSGPTSVISADLNSDGIADLAVTNQNSNTASVLLGQDLDSDGNGDGTFQAKQDFAAGSVPSSVISADFNGDTYGDLAVANSAANTVSVLLGQDLNGDNKADGTFQAKQDFAIQPPCTGDLCPITAMQAPNQVIAEDFNADGKDDLATANAGRCGFFPQPGGISVLLGNGNGAFQNAKTFSMGNPTCTTDIFGQTTQISVALSVSTADVNTDGKADLAATIENSNVVSVLRSNGDGTFSARQDFAVGTRPSAVTGIDLNGDAKADLAVSNFGSDNISVLLNNGSGGFTAAQNYSAGDGPAFVIGANFNADSFADLAVANQNSNNVSVLLNTEPPPPPPETTITSGPSGTVNSTSATFEFSSSEAGSTFRCSLDNPDDPAFNPCTSPQTVPEEGFLAQGSHTFYVKATGAGGTDTTAATRTWTVDTTAPTISNVSPAHQLQNVSLGTNVEATFSETMNASTLTSSTFTLTKPYSSIPVAATVSYSSTTDKATLNPSSNLASNTTYMATIKGGSTGAKDSAGNALEQDYSWTFTTAADTTPPETTIGSGPSGYVKSTSASFSFSSSEAGSTFRCSLDNPDDSAFNPCTSPRSYPGPLSQGNHTFRVRAIDKAGNLDTSPASRSWFVDTVLPKGTISINGGAASTSSRSVTLRLSASDLTPASGVASMRFRNGGTTTWTSWQTYSTSKSWTLTTGAGTKTVYVQYRDRAGNISAAASDTIRFSP